MTLCAGGNQTGDLLGILAALAQASGQRSDGLFLKAIADRQEDAALDMLRKAPRLVSGLGNRGLFLRFCTCFWGWVGGGG